MRDNLKYLNLFVLGRKMSIMAKVSILHRITGFFLFLSIPFFIYLFYLSLQAEHFCFLMTQFNHIWVKSSLWLILSFFVYHLVSGVRFLLFDVFHDFTLKFAKFSAYSVFLITAVLLIGVWIC